MTSLCPYLFFNGNCEAAFKYYETALGGKIIAMIPHAGTPAEGQVPAEWRDKIMHACLEVGPFKLMASDSPPEYWEGAPRGFSVQLAVEDPAEAERIFNALAENGKISMPLGKTFWAEKFGMLLDQFGTAWMINCEGKK